MGKASSPDLVESKAPPDHDRPMSDISPPTQSRKPSSTTRNGTCRRVHRFRAAAPEVPKLPTSPAAQQTTSFLSVASPPSYRIEHSSEPLSMPCTRQGRESGEVSIIVTRAPRHGQIEAAYREGERRQKSSPDHRPWPPHPSREPTRWSLSDLSTSDPRAVARNTGNLGV